MRRPCEILTSRVLNVLPGKARVKRESSDGEAVLGRGHLLRINLMLLGFQKRRRKLHYSRRTDEGEVRRVRDDRESVWRSLRSVDAGVALSAAQQFVELHDVFRTNRVGSRKHKQSWRLDIGHGC